MVLVGDMENVLEGLGPIVEVACSITVEDVCRELKSEIGVRIIALFNLLHFCRVEIQILNF